MPKLPSQDTLIEAFLSGYKKPETVKVYRGYMHQLVRWATSHKIDHIANLTAPHFDLYAASLAKSDNKINTNVGKQRVVKVFFDYLVRSGTIRDSPVPAGWVPSAVEHTYNTRLTRDDIQALFAACPSSRTPLDNGLLVALGGFDGVKLKHIIALRAEQVTFDGEGRGWIPVTRGDHLVHRIKLGPESSEHLQTVLDERPDGRLLFPDLKNPMSEIRARARRRLVLLSKSAGVQGEVTPRSLESSYRLRLVDDGNSLDDVLESRGNRRSPGGVSARGMVPKHGPGSKGAETRDRAVHQSDAKELLRQAELLCRQRSITPIAPIVIAGAALEMVLRRMCEMNCVVPSTKQPGIDAYSAALRAGSFISMHAHSVNQAAAKLRNEAAHGHQSGDISIPQARQMIGSIELFIDGSEYP